MSILVRKRQAQKKQPKPPVRPTRRKGVLARGAEALELPMDVLGNQARITLAGDGCALIENHRGILEVSDQSVRLLTRQGVLRILGEGLELCQVRPDALKVEGNIFVLELPHPAQPTGGEAPHG